MVSYALACNPTRYRFTLNFLSIKVGQLVFIDHVYSQKERDS